MLARSLLAIGSLLVLAAAPAHARRPMTLRVPTYDVPAVSDREVCTFVPVPGGAPFDIGGWIVNNGGIEAHSTSHHFIIYAYTGTDLEGMKKAYAGKAVDDNACIGIAPNPADLQFLGGAQTPRYRQIMPKGLALQVQSTGEIDGKKVIGFVLNSHWINSSDSTKRAKPRIKLLPAKPGSVKRYLKPIFEVVANGFLKVAPGEIKTTSWQWGPGQQNFGQNFGGVPNPDGAACVTMLTGHMHRRGTDFLATYKGAGVAPEKVYEGEKYDDPGQTNFNPPLLVSPGETIGYTCTQDNQTDPRLGCEEVAGQTPGESILESFTSGTDDFIHPAKRCRTDADCAGFGTGKCVEANLVFGFTSEDDMCIMPGYYYDADPVAGCDLSALQ